MFTIARVTLAGGGTRVKPELAVIPIRVVNTAPAALRVVRTIIAGAQRVGVALILVAAAPTPQGVIPTRVKTVGPALPQAPATVALAT